MPPRSLKDWALQVAACPLKITLLEISFGANGAVLGAALAATDAAPVAANLPTVVSALTRKYILMPMLNPVVTVIDLAVVLATAVDQFLLFQDFSIL